MSAAESKVIFAVRQVTIPAARIGLGGLDEPHAARNSQDASSQRSKFEAWIGDGTGSIGVRLPAHGIPRS